jgi:hypothetical protein
MHLRLVIETLIKFDEHYGIYLSILLGKKPEATDNSECLVIGIA